FNCRASGFVQSLESQPLSGLVLNLNHMTDKAPHSGPRCVRGHSVLALLGCRGARPQGECGTTHWSSDLINFKESLHLGTFLEVRRSSPRVAGYSDLGLILCRFWIEAQRGLVFVIELFSHRSHLPRSNSVTLTARQRSAARMSAPNISFRTARSPKALGMIL